MAHPEMVACDWPLEKEQTVTEEYSPTYQEEYQRLWHKAASERDRLQAENERLREALEAIFRDPEFNEPGPLTITKGQKELVCEALVSPSGEEEK